MLKNLRRRLCVLVATAVALTVGATLIQGPANAVTIAYGADVYRSTVIDRAADWNSRHIAYNQSANSWDENHGREYRQDCSGFVAMAWKLNGGNPVGSTGIYTGDLLDYAHQIDYNDMLPGDALLKLSGTAHVMIFDKWDSGFDSMWVYEESNPTTDMRHIVLTASWFHSNGYEAIRYDHIIKG